MRTETSLHGPYPGPRPFELEEQNLFFGRNREILELGSLVTAHRVVLVYAQSGAGKTSLLNAGLIPALKTEGFEVLPIARVRGLIPAGMDLREIPNIYTFNTLMSWIEDKVEPRSLASKSMAAFLREVAHLTDEQGLPMPRAVIFDQFEELFAFYPERWKERAGFFHQIAEAIEEEPLLRVVFVTREDYIASLDPYAHILPEQLRNRFRLELLRAESACLAVAEPLRSVGRSFAPGVAQELVQELLKIKVEGAGGKMVEAMGEFVEPVQLQVVCQNLWLDLPPNTKAVTADHLKAFGNVDEALKGFYERAIKTAVKEAGVREQELRTWFEQRLITAAGTRGTVFRGNERTEGIPNAAVDVLENQHLIRAELRASARWYELTHDRFIKPIEESNKEWRARMRQARIKTLGVAIGAPAFIVFVVGLLVPFTTTGQTPPQTPPGPPVVSIMDSNGDPLTREGPSFLLVPGQKVTIKIKQSGIKIFQWELYPSDFGIFEGSIRGAEVTFIAPKAIEKFGTVTVCDLDPSGVYSCQRGVNIIIVISLRPE